MSEIKYEILKKIGVLSNFALKEILNTVEL
jgi:hypothetical protein